MLYERTTLSKLPKKTIKTQLKELKQEDIMTLELVFRNLYFSIFWNLPILILRSIWKAAY
ncbi:MAG TPA: hypothetical protein PLX23_04085 [Candidatus Hydrogenedens sp.]|nr:hypothetical protein [Candidatus Hydrogenedens sp.]